MSTLVRKLCEDKNGNIVIAQRPNWPIIGWSIFFVIDLLNVQDTIDTTAKVIALVFILIWSGMEIFLGVNTFRRIVGVVIGTFISLFQLAVI